MSKMYPVTKADQIQSNEIVMIFLLPNFSRVSCTFQILSDETDLLASRESMRRHHEFREAHKHTMFVGLAVKKLSAETHVSAFRF